MSLPTHTTVLIAGAGPVGLLTALRLSRAGISVTLIEKHTTHLPTTRAIVYQPVARPALSQLGVLQAIERAAYRNDAGVVWRDVAGREKGTVRAAGMLLMGQQRVAKLILGLMEGVANVSVMWGWEVLRIVEEEGGVTVGVRRREDGVEGTVAAGWVVGADGANSAVREAVGIAWEGFTWEEFKMIGVDVWHDFTKSHGWTPMNFLMDRDRWAVIIYTGEDRNGDPYGKETPLWRIAYGEPHSTSDDPREVRRSAGKRIAEYARMKPEDVEISRAEPYKLQQRVAGQARKGRVVLAGDALHSNNPIGGLGLTTGIIDACCYSNVLIRIIKGGEPDSLLTECGNSRRDAWINVTNPVTTGNLRRLFSDDPKEVEGRDQFFKNLNSDPSFAERANAKIAEAGVQLFFEGAAAAG